ncbi:MAG: type I-C CRISPR-associated protein Cas8c/Csd1 [Spirochaetes bacterium]|nr:type I-C CRISPR-associated protein Cas8c/Csd1 [Spirochaetota bacterium]
MSELNAVYDRVAKHSKFEKKPLPLYHITNNAPLEITLNGKGAFCSARLLGKAEREELQTCMPCTEESAARTSGAEAYPFCDKLEYVASDYGEYVNDKKLKDKHDKYISLLEKWANSEHSNPKIQSVYNYVKKGTLIRDILDSQTIPEMDSPEKIADEKNNVFIRWNVEIRGDGQNKTWEDREIQDLWVKYYSEYCANAKSFCYVSGEADVKVRKLHPQKIRNSGDKAKLISANDNVNFTFRGRFSNSSEACQISMEATEKAHNALRWLIERQGAIIGDGLTIVAWCAAASEVKPQLLESTQDSYPDESDEQKEYYATGESAQAIKKRLLGYYGKVPDSDKILIMAVNAATPGRMSIPLYREFTKSDFYEAQAYWHGHLAWFFTYWKEKNPRRTVSAPSPEEIGKAAYGGHAGAKLKAMTVQRLLACIIDKAPIPSDIEQLCFNRASNLILIEGFEREKTLETACAVIKYNLYAKRKEEYAVGLEEDRNDRDYLYGRLLAVADKIESTVLDDRGENRQTNALRYMSRFAKYPCSTWDILYRDKLHPYLKYLKLMHPGRYGWYEGIIQNICDKFVYEDFSSDKALSGVFLLGYHCQQKDFWRKREKDQAVTENQQEE